jgi:GC-rich sequence DNA-binding factor
VLRPAAVPPAIHVPALGPAIARLSQTLTALTTSHATNSHSLSTLGEERARNDEREAELRKMIALAEEKRGWFAAFREWVESVATFLDEKVCILLPTSNRLQAHGFQFPALEKLENEHISILKERSDMVLRRRQADDEDDLSNFLGTLPVSAQPEPEQLDELGRVVPQANPAAARRDRRSARNIRRTYRRGRSQANQGEEGYSTDNSLPPSDAADYASAMRTLTADGEAILSDVRSEDFNDPNLGLGKWFSEWRSRFGESYTGAWGGLGLVGAWEFWVRMELLGWNPLEVSLCAGSGVLALMALSPG